MRQFVQHFGSTANLLLITREACQCLRDFLLQSLAVQNRQIRHLLQLLLESCQRLLITNNNRSLDVLQDSLVTRKLCGRRRGHRHTPHRFLAFSGSHLFFRVGEFSGQRLVFNTPYSLFQSRQRYVVTFDGSQADGDLHQVGAVDGAV
jgi:hypothetical protein